MADDKSVANHNGLNNHSDPVENGVENGVDNESGLSNGNSNLLDFVTRSYHDQRVSGAAGDLSQADEERRNNFFQRAISESQRMSAEVDRSQQRQDVLHAELGAANIHAWTMEHASQVIVSLLIIHNLIPRSRNSKNRWSVRNNNRDSFLWDFLGIFKFIAMNSSCDLPCNL